MMNDCVNSIKTKNPDFIHHLFDDDDCRNFIKDNFPEDVLYAYDTLIPGAYKADLWCYCILYKKGGIYLDIKFNCVNDFDFKELLYNEHFVLDKNKIGIYMQI
jgi:mannosyltransferase OCH1-like enzyme